jgi:hypothetical protein
MEHSVGIGNLIGLAIAMMLLAGADWIEEKVVSLRASAPAASVDQRDH